jgi:hypothetical protein
MLVKVSVMQRVFVVVLEVTKMIRPESERLTTIGHTVSDTEFCELAGRQPALPEPTVESDLVGAPILDHTLWR